MDDGDMVGMKVEAVAVTADMTGVGTSGGLGEGPGAEAREVEAEGSNELAGKCMIAFWAGPITCSKSG